MFAAFELQFDTTEWHPADKVDVNDAGGEAFSAACEGNLVAGREGFTCLMQFCFQHC